MSRYQKAVVAGTGTLALFCAIRLREAGVDVTLYDMDQGTPGFLARRAEKEQIAYEKPQPQSFFAGLAEASVMTLVVSAINPYIIPSFVLENPRITAINCHQALLPAHPGRNAEMWAIYEGDAKTGITWHMLTAKVDGGDILIQKELELTATHTAYQVFKEQIVLAQEAFEELLGKLLDGSAASYPQIHGEARKLHYSKDLPNQGILETDWDAEKISAFLRSMDYSILNVVAHPQICVDGALRSIRRYKIIPESGQETLQREGDRVVLQKPEMRFEFKIEA
jgi:methionyl-tRNA formyltransferase